MPRIFLEQCLERVEALDDAFGEIPALHTQADDDVGPDAVALAHGRAARGSRRADRLQPARRPFDRDRIRRDAADPALQRHRHMLVIDLAFHEAVHCVQEILQ